MGTTSKALSLLEFFARSRPEIGLSELARLSGLNKATTHRLLTEMAAHGFVEQVGARRAWRLGPAFLRLAALREAAVPLRELGRGALRALADATGETAHLSLIDRDALSSVAYAYSDRHAIQVRMEDAERLPFHATASGLAVLAFAPGELVEAVLARPLAALTPRTLTDPARIRAELTRIRADGLARMLGGFEADVHSLALPLFDATRHPLGAIAVAAPAVRASPELMARIRRALLREGTRLTRMLGGATPEDFPADAAA